MTLGSFWDDFGITLESFWDDFGINSGSFWDDIGMTLGSLWDHFGMTEGTRGDMPGEPGGAATLTQHIKKKSKNPISRAQLGKKHASSQRERFACNPGTVEDAAALQEALQSITRRADELYSMRVFLESNLGPPGACELVRTFARSHYKPRKTGKIKSSGGCAIVRCAILV